MEFNSSPLELVIPVSESVPLVPEVNIEFPVGSGHCHYLGPQVAEDGGSGFGDVLQWEVFDDFDESDHVEGEVLELGMGLKEVALKHFNCEVGYSVELDRALDLLRDGILHRVGTTMTASWIA